MRKWINLFEQQGYRDLTDFNLTTEKNVNVSKQELTSLEGSPNKVNDTFDCSYNNLVTLEGGPEIVGNDFFCMYNNLTSLEGAPEKIGGSFDCRGNTNLKPAGMAPILFSYIGGEFRSDYPEADEMINGYLPLFREYNNDPNDINHYSVSKRYLDIENALKKM